jgi:GNAT superfamily N-acetyltransferase
VAVWLPVGTDGPKLPLGYHQRLMAATEPWISRFMVFDAALEARYPVGEAHHHLALLGVRPERQGRGIGTALLEAHHQQLDEDGLPAYLEASCAASRRLYLRHAYTDLGPPIPLPGGPSLFPMWREPRGGAEEI